MNEVKNESAPWRERDRKVLWHPFTQHELWVTEDFPVMVAGAGVYLYDADGKKYLDGVSSLWLNVHGHRRPEIDEAIRDQLGRLSHSTFLGLSHPPGIELAEKLVAIAPPGLTRVFFSDDGSTAMEVALKMAYKYWCQQDPPQPEAKTFVKFVNAYHGDTLGSVSLGGLAPFHELYRPLLFPTLAAPSPNCYHCHLKPYRKRGQMPDHGPLPIAKGRAYPEILYREDCEKCSGCLCELERVLAEQGDEIAAVVIEPLVQGAAGMITQPAGFVRSVAELCEKYGVLLIADEVAVGFGRTGAMFACNVDGVTPDLMAVGKGLSGGYLPIAATLTTEEVFEAFLGPNHLINTFFHGHSYTANPLACAAAKASLDLFEKDQTLQHVRQMQDRVVKKWFERLGEMPHVGDVRGWGLMIGIELAADPHTQTPYDEYLMMGRRVCLAAREKGLIIRPLGDVVVLMPPLCVSESELDEMLSITAAAIKEITE